MWWPKLNEEVNLRLIDNKKPRIGYLRKDGYFVSNTTIIHKDNLEWLKPVTQDGIDKAIEWCDEQVELSDTLEKDLVYGKMKTFLQSLKNN